MERFSEVSLSPSDTSYFSKPETELDPRLFIGTHLRPWVRNGIQRLLYEHLKVRYMNAESWTIVWLAGSGVSYQWSATRDPADLDCLVGVDYITFKKYNNDYLGLSNDEIAHMFNKDFNTDLMPNTKNWEGYELTYYVNPQSDIRDINPYAAYNLTSDSWTVEPNRNPRSKPDPRAWENKAERDYETALELVNRYAQALNEVQATTNPAYRLNAQRRLEDVVDQAVAFYNSIHEGRKVAFSSIGSGYEDFNNYRWQAGKQSGAIHALKAIKDYRDGSKEEKELETYGMVLPDTETLIRRAATHRRP